MMMPGFKLMQCRDEKEKEAKKWEKSYTYYTILTVLCFSTRQYLSSNLDNRTVTKRLVAVVDDSAQRTFLPAAVVGNYITRTHNCRSESRLGKSFLFTFL